MLSRTTIALFPMMAAAMAGVAQAEVEKYRVDPVHSSVIFRIKHLNVAYFYGRFNEISGRFTFGDADGSGGSFEFEVPAESIDTNNGNRDKHLRSADFFSASDYTKITFRSTRVEKAGDDKFKVEGELTLLAETRPLTVEIERTGKATDQRGTTRAGFETTFTIKRSDFGMTGMMQGLGDEVRLTVSVEGILEKGDE